MIINLSFIDDIAYHFVKRNLAIGDKKQILHKWFAWHPVNIGNFRWVWLSSVMRKYRSYNGYPIYWFTSRYREPTYYEIKIDTLNIDVI